MTFVSIGDIVVCTQLAFQLYTSLTSGRKKAPRDMQELEDVLFGLFCALSHLQREHEFILNSFSHRAERDSVQTTQQLGRMINSCLRVLNELDEVTARYRHASHDLTQTVSPSDRVFGVGFSQQLKAQAKVQWQRIQWYLRSDSFAKYRTELQLHTSAINLLLNTIAMSNATQFQEIARDQTQRLGEIEQTMTLLNENMGRLVQTVSSSRSRHPVLVVPRLIISIRESQQASLPVTILDHVMHVPPPLLDASFFNHWNLWRPVSTAISPTITRIQHRAHRHISGAARQVTEESKLE